MIHKYQFQIDQLVDIAEKQMVVLKILVADVAEMKDEIARLQDALMHAVNGTMP